MTYSPKLTQHQYIYVNQNIISNYSSPIDLVAMLEECPMSDEELLPMPEEEP